MQDATFNLNRPSNAVKCFKKGDVVLLGAAIAVITKASRHANSQQGATIEPIGRLPINAHDTTTMRLYDRK